MGLTNSLDTLSDLSVGDKTYRIYSLAKLEIALRRIDFETSLLNKNTA